MFCLGEKGIGKGTQKPLHYKGCLFHRIVKDFMLQGGDFSEGELMIVETLTKLSPIGIHFIMPKDFLLCQLLCLVLIFYHIIGNGRGGESIYGGFFEGKEGICQSCQYWLCTLTLASRWWYNVVLFLQMKALLLNTTRSTCCLWPIGAKIQMDRSFSCTYSNCIWLN